MRGNLSKGKAPRGERGEPGNDGYSPKVTVEPTESGHEVTIQDKYGLHTFNVENGKDGKDATNVIPDLSQNDETKPDYVKNRTHYEGNVLIGEGTATGDWSIMALSQSFDLNNASIFLDDKEVAYEVWDNRAEEDLIQIVYGGAAFLQYYNASAKPLEITITPSASAGTHIQIYQKSVKTLDEKFIPNTIARTADVEKAESDIEEIKTFLPDEKTKDEISRDTKTYVVDCGDDVWVTHYTEEKIGLIPKEEYVLKIEGVNTDGSVTVSEATVKVDEDGNLAYNDDKYDVYIYDSTIDFNIVDYSNITATVFTVSITGNFLHKVVYRPKIASEEYVKEYVDENSGSVAETFDYTKYPLPILYLDGDTSTMTKETEVSLAYRYKAMEGTANVKWQGSSSLAYPKKNYTVKFDTAFEAKEGWGAQKKYVMKANWIDFSHSRNIVSAKIWGECIRRYETYVWEALPLRNLPNGGAVDGFPIVMVINGEYQGLYTFSIPKDGWLLGLSETNPAHCIIGASGVDNEMCGFFKMPYIDDDQGFEYEFLADNVTEDKKSGFQTSLQNLYTALKNCDSRDKLINNVGAYLRLEKAVAYMVYCAHLGNYDGLTKNYLLWQIDGRWHMSAYDLDATFGNNPYGDAYYYPGQFDYARLASTNMIFRKIYDYGQDLLQKWHERLYMLSPGEVNKVLYQYAVQIPKIYFDEEVKVWEGIPGTKTNTIEQAMTFCEQQRQFLEDEIGNKKATEAYVDDKIGDISGVLDELHTYAQSLVGGDA